MKQSRKLSGLLAIVGGLSLLLLLQSVVQLPGRWADAQGGNARPPVVALEPDSLASVQLTDSLISQTLAIHNLGDESLEWHVFDEAIALWEQTDNMSANNAAPSQYFPDPELEAGGFAADDFVVPSGQTWQVNRLLIPGVYADNDEQAPNFDVKVYADAAGTPGTLVVSTTVYPTSDISGEVTLDLAPPLPLSPGLYWLSVNANALFGASQTQWFWRTRTTQTGSPYHWMETSAGIFGTPCVDVWQPGAAVCGTGGGVDPDLLFRIQGFYPEANCDTLHDLPWVQVSPLSGTVSVSGTTTVMVGFDSSGYGSGVYTGTLCIVSNDPGQSLASLPLTMTVVPEHGVSLTADTAAGGQPGTDVNYTLWLTNTGLLADVYTLTVSSQWTTTLPANTFSLNGQEAATVAVTVNIPVDALEGEMDTAVITAVSQANPAVSDSATLSTTASLSPGEIFIYLPFIHR